MRYQRGQQIPIVATTPGLTDGPPIATVLDPDSSLVAMLRLPFNPSFRSPTSFVYSATIRLPGGATLGTYSVSISYSILGVNGTQTSSFDVVPGGDSGGEVISLYSYTRPEASYVLAQLASGKLVQGKNPHL